MLAPTVALVLSLLAPLVLIPFLGSQGLVDMPGERRSHAVPTVRGGGIGVSLAFLCALLAHIILMAAQGTEYIPASYLGLGLIMVWFTGVGIFDDIYGLSTRGGIMFLSAGGMGVGIFVYCMLRYFAPNRSLIVAIVVMLLAIPLTVWVTNAVNYMDGINGITTAHVLTIMTWFWLISPDTVVDPIIVFAPTFGAAFLGFLPWNVPSARLFLGEAGAYAAGAAAMVMGLTLWAEGVSWVACCAPFLMYWMDVIVTGIRRVRRHKDALRMHREHNYQWLARYLESDFNATLIVTLMQLLSLCIVVMCGGVDAPSWAIIPTAVPAVLFCLLPIGRWDTRRKRMRTWSWEITRHAVWPGDEDTLIEEGQRDGISRGGSA